MTTYFAFKLADATQQGMDELLANLAAGTSTPQHTLHTRVSVEMVDEILRNCVEELIKLFQDGAEGAGILNTLINLLKGTAHGLVKQMLGKHDNKEVARMAEHLRTSRVVIGNEVRFGFELPAALASRFAAVFAAVDAGQGKENRDALQATMLEFAELALIHFYDDFVRPMELGFIKQKVSDVGRATINKGIQVAIKKLVPQLGQKDMALFVAHYRSMIVQA